MRAKQPQLLLHPLFLISVAALLLNDFYLKYEFHNWLTGKLSDFAGLFAFSIFFIAFFPANKKIVLFLTASFFLWWKSSLSDPVIFIFNNDFNLPLHRTFDYSDNFALVMVPLAHYLKPISCPRGLIQKMVTGLVCIVSLFSFTATSMARRLADDNRVLLGKTIHTRKSENEIVSSLEQEGLNTNQIPAIYERDWDRGLYVKARDKFGDTAFVRIDSIYPELYRKINYGKVYNIPVMYIQEDSIFNLQFIISGEYSRRKEIFLHSFEYRRSPANGIGGEPYNRLQYDSYMVSKKIGRPVKKRIKQIIKGKN